MWAGWRLACIAGLVSGCYAYRQVPLAPAPTSQVRVVLRSPQPVTTVSGTRDSASHTYEGVLEMRGVIEAASADTMSVRLGELRTATGPVDSVSGRLALVATSQVARLEERRFQAGATALGGLGIAALTISTMVILTILAIVRSF